MTANKTCLSSWLLHAVLIYMANVSVIKFTKKYLQAHFKDH